MAMVNVNNLLNIKDSRWLQGRCNREKPPCKYFHPPLHLKDQLLINGRNHLALKNALMQQMGLAPGQGQGVVPGQIPIQATNPYLGVTSQGYNPYFAGPLVPLVTSDPTGAVVSPLGVQQTVVQQKVPRGAEQSDMNRSGNNSGQRSSMRPGVNHSISSPWDNSNKRQRESTEDIWMTYPGMVTYKRPAGADKSGVPVYQPANTPSGTSYMAAYQQLMQLQQPFVPVSSNSIQQHHHHQQQQQQQQQQQHSAGGNGPSSSTLGQQEGISNGNLDSRSESPAKRVVKVDSDNDNNDLDGVGTNNANSNDDDDSKETAMKRMRGGVGNNSNSSNQGGLLSGINNTTAASLSQQNNAAYVAAAQSYHNALAAINYTGVALQTNKSNAAQTSAVSAAGQSYPTPGTAPSFQSQQQANQQAAMLSQQQQIQQQQLLQQYQAMAAALAQQMQVNPAAAAAVAQQQQQQQGGGNNAMNFNNAAQLALNPLVAQLNPLLAATFPQLAAAQRASMLANQGGVQGSHYANASGVPGSIQASTANLNNPAAFNPLAGVQLAAAGNPGLTFQQQNQNQQHALLAAYGQFARGPVPAVSGASQMASQQLFVPAAAAAAAAASQGVKRMRPS